MLGFKLISVRIEDECSVVIRSIVWPETGSTLVHAAKSQRSRMKPIDGLTTGGDKGQMEAWPRRGDRAGLKIEQQSVVFRSRQAVPDRSRSNENSSVPKRHHSGIVERCCPRQLA